MKEQRRRLLWILSGPAALALLLLALYLVQRYPFTTRLLDNFDIATRRVQKALESDASVREAKIVILGDSTAFFNLSPLALPEAVSLALSNSTIRESYFTLKRLLALGARPNCIVASFTFQWPDADKYFWSMFVRNDFYSIEDLAEIRSVHFLDESPFGREAAPTFWTKVFLYRAKISGHPLERVRRVFFPDSDLESRKAKFLAALDRGKGWTGMLDPSRFRGEFRERFTSPPHRMPSTDAFSRKLTALLEAHDIRLFLVDTPISSIYSEAERVAYERGFSEAAAALLAAPQVKRIRLPVLPESYFFTAGHLLLPGSDSIMPTIRQATEECAKRADR